MVTRVQCPVCTQPVTWSEASPWRPFCSERCKMIDLGDWAANRHVIAGNSMESASDGASDHQGSDQQRTH